MGGEVRFLYSQSLGAERCIGILCRSIPKTDEKCIHLPLGKGLVCLGWPRSVSNDCFCPFSGLTMETVGVHRVLIVRPGSLSSFLPGPEDKKSLPASSAQKVTLALVQRSLAISRTG